MTGGADPEGVPRGPVLAIDAAALVRKLAAARVHEPSQLVVELVRWAVRRDASRVMVRVRRNLMEVADDGRPPALTTLGSVVAALDPDEPAARRREAAAWLDGAGMSPLLALSASPWQRAAVTSPAGGLEVVTGTKPDRLPPGADLQTVIRLWGRADRRRVRAAVRRACRFTPASVVLDDAPVAVGFSEAVIQGRVERPLPAQLAVPRQVQEPFVWLLMDGVVAATAAVPGVASFEAAVELSERAAYDATASDLRDVVRPYAATLLGQALMLLARALETGRLAAQPRLEQTLLYELLRSLAAGRGDRCLESRPVVPALGAEVADRLSIAELRRRVTDGVLECTDPREAMAAEGVDELAAPVLGEACRSVLGGWFGVRVVPRLPAKVGGLRGWWLRACRARLLQWATRALLRRPVPNEQLEAIHETVATAVERALSRSGRDLEVGWAHGRQLVRSRSRLLLPLDDPELGGWLELVEREPEWLHPLVRTVTGGAADRRWRSRWWRASFTGPP